MKNIMIIIFLMSGIWSCSQNDVEITPDPTILRVTVHKFDGIADDIAQSAFLFLYKAEGRDFKIDGISNLTKGYVFDQIEQKLIKYDVILAERGGRFIINPIEPGNYYVVVLLNEDDDNRHSGINVKIEKSEFKDLKKVFTEYGFRYAEESW